jgi:hypothetical protein
VRRDCAAKASPSASDRYERSKSAAVPWPQASRLRGRRAHSDAVAARCRRRVEIRRAKRGPCDVACGVDPDAGSAHRHHVTRSQSARRRLPSRARPLDPARSRRSRRRAHGLRLAAHVRSGLIAISRGFTPACRSGYYLCVLVVRLVRFRRRQSASSSVPDDAGVARGHPSTRLFRHALRKRYTER